MTSTMQKDIDRKIKDDFDKWLKDAAQLYQMAELPKDPSCNHLINILLSSASMFLALSTTSREEIHATIDMVIDRVRADMKDVKKRRTKR